MPAPATPPESDPQRLDFRQMLEDLRLEGVDLSPRDIAQSDILDLFRRQPAPARPAPSPDDPTS